MSAHHDLWSQTFSGRAVDLLDPQPDQISWIDIAIHLSRQVRFVGATNPTISIAQHSIRVAEEARNFHIARVRATSTLVASKKWTPPDLVYRYGLLHDGHEYIFGDWTRPSVRSLAARVEERSPGLGIVVKTAIDDIKAGLDCVIFAKAGLAWPMPPDAAKAVRWADDSVGATEHRDLMADPPRPTCWPEPPLRKPATGGWSAEFAFSKFLEALDAAGIDRAV